MIDALIDRYERDAGALRAAVAGLGREQRLARPVPGTMSVQALAMHMLDADLAYADRMKRIAALDRPRLLGWDQDAFAERLGYESLDAGLAARATEDMPPQGEEAYRQSEQVNRQRIEAMRRQQQDTAVRSP